MYSASDTYYTAIPAYNSNTNWHRHPTYRMYPFFWFLRAYLSYIQVHQATKGVKTSYKPLLDLLESIEHLLQHLDIYAQIPPTPAMDEMVVKIMAEILVTLALMTKDLNQGRPSESNLADVLHKLKAAQRYS